MFLGLVSMATGAVGAPLSMVAAPTSAVSTATSVVGVAQTGTGGQNPQQKSGDNKGSENDPAIDPRLAKFTLTVHCDSKSSVKDQVHDKQVVLRDGKVRTTPQSMDSRYNLFDTFSSLRLIS